jgi:hypothetical protein
MVHVALALQLTLGGTFLLAGLAKLRRGVEIRVTVTKLLTWVGIRSRAVSGAAAWVLMVAEVITGAAILARGRVGDIGLIMAGLLLLAFTGVAVLSAVGAVRLECPCFGRTSAVLGWRHVVRNFLLLGMAAIVLAVPQVATVEPGGLAVSVLAATVLTVLAASTDAIVDLITLPSPQRHT